MAFKFKPDAKAEIGTEDPWYALTDGGYLKPEEVLTDAGEIKALNDAIYLVRDFISECYENKVIEEV